MKTTETVMIFRRFLELLATNAAISTIITILNRLGILRTRQMLFWGLLIGAAVFIAIHVFLLRDSYFELKEKKKYYFANILAYLMYAVLAFIVDGFGWNQLYAFFFATTKVIRFTSVWVKTEHSALFFHCVFLAVIFLAPVGEDWNEIFNEEEREEEMKRGDL